VILRYCFFWGVLGGIGAEFLAIHALRYKGPPPWLKTLSYWITAGIMCLIGGFFVLIYHWSGIKIYPLLAVHIGASAALILKELAGNIPPEKPRVD